jgi:hypothetical protein
MQKLIQLTLAIIVVSSFANSPKYKVGDCITPFDISFSWFGAYARVTAVLEGKDAIEGKTMLYQMNFINYDTKANEFVAKIIDSSTTKVDTQFCKPRNQ